MWVRDGMKGRVPGWLTLTAVCLDQMEGAVRFASVNFVSSNMHVILCT